MVSKKTDIICKHYPFSHFINQVINSNLQPYNLFILTLSFLQVEIFVGDVEAHSLEDPLVRPFKTSQAFKEGIQLTGKYLGKTGSNTLVGMRALGHIQSLYCNDVLGNTDVMAAVRRADLVIGDSLDMCGSLIAAQVSLPYVTVFTTSLSAPTAHAFGLPLNPAYVPQFKSALSDNLSFLERIKNLYHWIFSYLVFYSGLAPPFQGLKDRYKIAPNKTLHEVFNSVELIIAQMAFFLDYPRPVLPSKL